MNDDSQATDFTSQRVTVDVIALSPVILSEAQKSRNAIAFVLMLNVNRFA